MRKELIVLESPKAPVSEVFRTLRTNIQFMDVNKKTNTLLITSTFQSEGKSWITANLSLTFAQAKNKVLLIDSDMRKGRQYTMFNLPPKPGLSDLLSKIEIDKKGNLSENVKNYINKTEVENLSVMTSGTVPPNPSELLVSGKMVRVLEELKRKYDMIIIDGSPCELVTDSIILSRLVDSTLIVTSHKSTKKEALGRVIRNIQNVGGKISGIVINKVPVSMKLYSEKNYYYGAPLNTKDTKEKNAKYKKNKARVDENLKQKDGKHSNKKNEQIRDSKNKIKRQRITNEKAEQQINSYLERNK